MVAEDLDKGSWVVAYNVFRDDQFIRQVYGCKFVDPLAEKDAIEYKVEAVNVSGTLSNPVIYEQDTSQGPNYEIASFRFWVVETAEKLKLNTDK